MDVIVPILSIWYPKVTQSSTVCIWLLSIEQLCKPEETQEVARLAPTPQRDQQEVSSSESTACKHVILTHSQPLLNSHLDFTGLFTSPHHGPALVYWLPNLGVWEISQLSPPCAFLFLIADVMGCKKSKLNPGLNGGGGLEVKSQQPVRTDPTVYVRDPTSGRQRLVSRKSGKTDVT